MAYQPPSVPPQSPLVLTSASRRHVGLRQKILINIDVPLFIGIIVTMVLAVAFVYSYYPNWISATKNAIFDEEMANLDRLSSTKGEYLEDYFAQLAAEVNTAVNFAARLYGGAIIPSSNYNSFPNNGLISVTPTLPWPLYYDAVHRIYASREDVYWYSHEVLSATDKAAMGSDFITLVNSSSAMSAVFKMLFISNVLYYQLYIGLASHGIMVGYPYKRVDSWPTLAYTCASTNQPTIGYDPRCRPWYTAAMQSPKGVVFTAPYVDSSSHELVISPARVVLVGTQQIGVLATDFVIDQLGNSVLNTKILNRGYAFVIDYHGMVFMHPLQDKTKPAVDLVTLEFGAGNEPTADFERILANMKAGETGADHYTKDGALWYISYNAVPTASLSIAVLVPESDVNEAMDEVTRNIRTTINVQIGVFIAVVVLVGFIVYYWSIKLADRIILPVQTLTMLTESIAKGNLNFEMADIEAGSSDIDRIFITFRSLFTAVKFGNTSFFSGKLEVALQNYVDALKLFTELNNTKGVGLCYNNMGNVYFEQSKWEEAMAAFTKAVEIARELLEQAEKSQPENPVEVAKQQAMLASRLNNVGMVLCEISDYEKAEIKLMEALLLYEKARFIFQYTLHVTRVVDFMLRKLHDKAKAKDVFLMAKSLISQASDNFRTDARNFATELDIAQRYITYIQGLIFYETGNQPGAVTAFISALEGGPFTEKHLQKKCLKFLTVLFQEIDHNIEEQLKRYIQENVEEEQSMARGIRDVMFVLDYSGSMSGARIAAAFQNIALLFEKYMYDGDYVGLNAFSTRVNKIFDLQPFNLARMTQYINELRLTSPVGSTSLYDALLDATRQLKARKEVSATQKKWIVALTDGEDNASVPSSYPTLMKLLPETEGLSVVIIGLFLEKAITKQVMKDICKATTGGLFLDVSEGKGLEGLDEAFRVVVTLLSDGRINLEDFST